MKVFEIFFGINDPAKSMNIANLYRNYVTLSTKKEHTFTF